MNNNEVKECKYQKPTFGFILCGEYEHQTHCCDINDCYFKQLLQLKAENEKFRKANDEKNEFLQQLGINSSGEFKRIKFYIDILTQKLEKAREALEHIAKPELFYDKVTQRLISVEERDYAINNNKPIELRLNCSGDLSLLAQQALEELNT